MDVTTRDTASVVGTTIHEDFFEPRPCHSQGHSNPDLSHRTTSHLAVDGTKTIPKAKRKALGFEFLQPNLVVIQNLLYRLLLPLLFFIQARRTGFAVLKWQAILGKKDLLKYFTSYLNYVFSALFGV